jgi:hypothetical protein
VRLNIRSKLWMAALLACATAAGVCEAAEWLPAKVSLSDGRTMEGRVSATGDSIVIFNDAQARRQTVRMVEIARLDTSIESQSMEEKWIFKESGLDDKIFLGQFYPVRRYVTKITFHDGRALEGHIVPATLYTEVDGERDRQILRFKDEGKVGQKLDDLLYVRSVVFAGEGAGARGTIEGTISVPKDEKLQQALAINRDKLFSIPVALNAASGGFKAADCTEGVYDLIVLTDRSIYVYFSREQDAKCSRLDTGQVAQIQEWIARLREFFHTQEIVYAAGNEDRTFALVRMERHGGTTLQGAELIRRYEVWALYKAPGEWQIEKRMFLDRLVTGDAAVRQRRIVVSPVLGGHCISAEADDLKLELKLAPNREPVIPEPGELEAQKQAEQGTGLIELIEVPAD